MVGNMQKDCKVCLVEHDEEIHEASVRLHEWLRYKVTRNLGRPEEAEARPNAA